MGSAIQFAKSGISDFLFNYTTPREVEVRDTYVGILRRFMQLSVLAYITIYIIWWQKGYQMVTEPTGSSVIKVKGVARVTENPFTHSVQADIKHLWDVAEYQLPPLENNAVFIATRQIVTYNQTESKCPTALSQKLRCNISNPNSCPIDQPTPDRVGFITGECVQSPQNPLIDVCEMYGWCPDEETKSVILEADIDDVRNFTVLMKTSVTFDLFDINLRNVPTEFNTSCRYDKDKDPYCPIVYISTILNNLIQPTNQTALFLNGGLIEIRQDWTCNFDLDSSKCFPKYKFKVLQSGNEKSSPGVNYRYGIKLRVDGKESRTLSKVFGLRFVVVVSGQGRQFNIVSTTIAVGSGIKYMVIASLVCNFIFWRIHKFRNRYREHKTKILRMTSKLSSQENLVLEKNTSNQSKRNSTFSES